MKMSLRAVVAAHILAWLGSSALAQTTGTALVRHAPSVNGTVEGTVQQMQGESVILNGGAIVTENLAVPGTPTVRLNGHPNFGGTIIGTGSASPSGYEVTLNGNARLGHLRTRTNAVALSSVSAPPAPSGSRSVNINSAGQSVGAWATLRNLNLNGNVGQYVVPAGTYGDFTANGGSGFTLGVAGSTQPIEYRFQRLTLNGQARINVVSPVVITLANGLTHNGQAGTYGNPGWLEMRIASGGLTLNGGSAFYGYVFAPNGTVIVNGNSELSGGIECDRLTVNGGGLLRLWLRQSGGGNQPPVANGQSVTGDEDTALPITLLGVDPDNGSLTYTITTPPSHGTLSGAAPSVVFTPAANYNGSDSFAFTVSDGAATSAPAAVGITVRPINDAPTAQPQIVSMTEDSQVAIVLAGTDIEGSALTYSVVTGPAHGSLSGAAPNRTYTPTANYHGDDSFTFRVRDGELDSTPATVLIHIGTVPDAPVAVPLTLEVNEDQVGSITLSGSDADGDVLTFSVETGPAHGALSGLAPHLAYTPLPDFFGADQFSYTANDGGNTSAAALVQITVHPRNDAPVAVAQAQQTNEDTPLTLQLAANDVDGDALAYRVVEEPQHGVLSGIAPNVVYTPYENFSGADSFTFAASDSVVESTPAAVTLVVRPINDPPTALVQTVATVEDTAVDFVLLGADVDGDALAYEIVAGPTHGVLNIAPEGLPHVTYVPAADFADADEFTFRVFDGTVWSAPAVVTLHVGPMNDAPVAQGQNLVTAEDTPLNFVLTATDVDGESLQFEVIAGPTHGVLSGTAPNLTYAPVADFHDQDSLQFRVTDAAGSHSEAVVVFTVTPVNDAPVAQSFAAETAEDTPKSLTLAGSDVDGDALTFEIVAGPAHGALSGTAPSVTYTPAPDFHAGDTFTFRVFDGTVWSSPAAVTLTVTPVNDAPVAQAAPATVAEDTSVAITLTGSDVDEEPLLFEISAGPAHGTLSGTAPALTYTPAADFNGTDTFRFRALDAAGASSEAVITIAVTPVNDAPVLGNQSITVAEDGEVPVTFAATDVDGDSLTYTVAAAPTHGVVVLPFPTLRYRPTADYSGPDEFRVRVSDGHGGITEATVTVDVTPVNDAPSAVPRSLSLLEDTIAALLPEGSDPENSPLTFSIVEAPAHGQIIGSTPDFYYSPEPNFSGTDRFTYRAYDGELNSAPVEVTVTVVAVNDPPAANPQTVEVDEDGSVNFVLTAHDAENDGLSFTLVSTPQHGTLSGTAPNLTYTPAANFAATDTLVFRVNDGEFDSEPATVTLVVRPINDAPVAQNQSVQTGENVAADITLVAEDIDGDPLTYTITANPQHGTLSGTGANRRYTPIAGYFGADTFKFKVSDGTATSAVATVSIVVGADPRSRTFTTTSDFEEGGLIGMSTDPADQLQVTTDLTKFDSLWVPKSSAGTVCRLDPETGRVLAEYATAPQNTTGNFPSRIAIDSRGDAWIGDYRGGGIVKITQADTGRWVDRNHNGRLDTSTGMGEVLPWTGAFDDNGAGAADELVLLRVTTELSGVRTIAVAPNDNIWVSGTGPSDPWLLIHGRTGEILRREPNVGRGGWVGFVDLAGSLYSTGERFLRWDTHGPISARDPHFENVVANSWDVARDSQGNFWVTVHYHAYVYKYSPTGELLGSYYHGRGSTEGLVIDQHDHVWVAHSHCGHTVGHLTPEGVFLGEIPIALPTELSVDRKGRVWVSDYRGLVARINPLGGPVGLDGVTPLGEIDLISQSLNANSATLGDFAGNAKQITEGAGQWTFQYDGIIPQATWEPLTWNTLITNDGDVQVVVALSDDGVNFGTEQTLTIENPTVQGRGRYLRGRVKIVSATTGESPALYDLTVGTRNAQMPAATLVARASAGPDLESNWPDTVEIKGAVLRSAHQLTSTPTFMWTVVSGPGTVSFDDVHALRPKAQFNLDGTYVLRLTAVINGETQTDEVTIHLVPFNRAPWVDGGRDLVLEEVTETKKLKGSVRDDGLPLNTPVQISWTKRFGPGTVTFSNPADPQATVGFSAPGIYLLQLTASDGEFTATDVVEARVAVPCTISEIAGLSAWWQGNADGIDHVGGNIAQLENGADYDQGKVSGAYKFDGVNDRLSLFAAPSLDVGDDEGLSLEFWIKPDGVRDATLFEYGTLTAVGVSVRTRANGSVEFHLVDTAGTDHLLSAGGLPNAAFTHVVLTWNRTSGRGEIYLNGSLRSIANLGTVAAQTTYDLFIGANRTGAQAFKGLLDEISLYSRPLDAELIYELFAADSTGKCPPGVNMGPVVEAGEYLVQKAIVPVPLKGSVKDDGLPAGGHLRSTWTVVSGPGTVDFADASDPHTTATFSQDGAYSLKLTATDGAIISVDFATVNVGYYCTVEAPAGILSWWPGNGNAQDAMGQNHGIFANGKKFTSGSVERAFDFDGNNYVRVPSSPSLDVGKLDEFSLEFWTKSAAESRNILGWSDGNAQTGVYLFREQFNHRLWVELYDVNGGRHYAYFEGIFPPDQWLHLGLTFRKSDGLLRVYRNGLFYGQWSLGNFAPRTDLDFWLGGSPSWNSRFRGQLDEVSFYSRALRGEEIAAIYQVGPVGKCPPGDNEHPVVNAGPDTGINGIAESVHLRGSVEDDGLPVDADLEISWRQLAGPGTAAFAGPSDPQSMVSFDQPGRYELELSARDGEAESRDVVEITVGQACTLGDDSSLLSWWTGNRTTDDAIGQNHGFGAFIKYASGEVGSAFDFDGNAYVRVPGSTSMDVGTRDEFSLEFWANSVVENRYIMGWSDGDAQTGVHLYREQFNHRLWVEMYDTNGGRHYAYFESIFPPGQWLHFGLTFRKSDGLLRLYRNGLFYGQWVLGTFTPRTNLDFWLGGSPTWSSRFKGQLDEVSFYNRVLLGEEIAAIYQAGAVGKCRPGDNEHPIVQAGPDTGINSIAETIHLQGSVEDDGLPVDSSLQISWKKLAGPGTANFSNLSDPQATVSFDLPGRYELELSARDGEAESRDVVEVTVGQACMLGKDPSLLSWWTGNRTTDDAVGQNHGIGSFLNYTPGEVGSAFDFDGNGYVRVPSTPSLDVGTRDEFSLEFWANSAAETRNLMGWSDGNQQLGVHIFREQFNNRLWVEMYDTNGGRHYAFFESIFPAGQWIHLGLTFRKSDGLLRVYRNGLFYAQWVLGPLVPRTNLDFWLGGAPTWGSRFRGQLDEVSFYRRVLLGEEMAAIYQAGAVGKYRPNENHHPEVDAGPDTGINSITETIQLRGRAEDDGLPADSSLVINWRQLAGPGMATFASSSDPQSTVSFDAPGRYELELSARDGQGESRDVVEITVGQACTIGEDSSLVSWWSGNRTTDDVMARNPGVGSFINYTNGTVGSAFDFDGNAYVRIPGATNLDVGTGDGFTLEFWVNSVAENRYLMGWSDGNQQTGVHLYREQFNNRLWVEMNDVIGGRHYAFFEGIFPAGQWMHLGVTFRKSDGLVRVYRNGLYYGQWGHGNIAPRTNLDFWLGGAPTWSSRFKGQLDEVSIYNRVLLGEELSAIYQAGAVGKCQPGDNRAPIVNAGPDQEAASVAETVQLRGSVSDDGLPVDSSLITQWTKLAGPGPVSFSDSSDPRATATFTVAGRYELQLSARDGIELTTDLVEVTVGQAFVLTPDNSLVSWWSGNRNPDDVMGRNPGYAAFPTYTAGVVGSAFSFDGSNYVRVPASEGMDLGTGNEFSVELWVNSVAETRNVLGWSDGNQQTGVNVWREQFNNRLWVEVTDTIGGRHYAYFEGFFPANQWLHLTLTFRKSDGLLQVYRNGSYYGQWVLGNFTPRTNLDFWLGGSPTWGSRFRGWLDEVCVYNRALTAAEITAIYNSGAVGKQHPEPPNTGPVAQAGNDQTIQLPANFVQLNGAATDDGLPRGSAVSYAWSVVSGPDTVAFTNASSPNTSASFSRRGTYVLRLAVSDGALSDDDDVTVNVLAPINLPPQVNAGSDIVLAPGVSNVTLAGLATDDSEPEGSSLAVTWSQQSGPAAAVFSDSNSLDAVVSFPAPGVYRFALTATDGTLTSSDTVQVRIRRSPTVAITSPANNVIVAPGANFTAKASASDPDGSVARVDFLLDGTPAGNATIAPYQALIAGLPAGTHSLTAVVTDNEGDTATSGPVIIRGATDPGRPPRIEITSPDDAATVTGPVVFIGSADSEILTSYKLEYLPKGDECAEWVTFATGTQPVTDGPLGTLDTTLLLNGIYEIRLTARDAAGRGILLNRDISVEGDMKVGHFTISFADITVPVAGVPMTVTRTYDSRRRCPGDFGYGWTLDLDSIRVEKNYPVGQPWSMVITEGTIFDPSTYEMADVGPHTVTVKMPDGDVLRFQPKLIMDRPYNRLASLLDGDGDDIGQAYLPIGENQPIKPIFRAQGGTQGATLEARGYKTDQNTFAPANGPFYTSWPGDGDFQLATAPNHQSLDEPLVEDATGWKLTTKDGRIWLFGEDGKLEAMEDRQGNRLDIVRNALGQITRVTHSSGQALVFERGDNGRIERVIDPRGNATNYVYNAGGELISYFDRTANPDSDAPTQTFSYRTGNHLLEDLFDAKGIRTTKNFYDAAGRLSRTVDANGKETLFTHDVNGRIETITDRSGQITRHYYDERGNVTRTEQPDGSVVTTSFLVWSDGRKSDLKTSETVSGLFANAAGQLVQKTQTTTYAYEDEDPATRPLNDGLLRKVTDPMGRTTRFSYDDRGNVTEVEDSLGRKTISTYYSNGNLLATTTDAEGNVTTMTYDGHGQLDTETRTATVVDGQGQATVQSLVTDYDFDARGFLVKMTDAEGHVTTYENDENGNQLFVRTTRTNTQGQTVSVVTENAYDANDRLTRTWDAEHPRVNLNDPPTSETLYDDNGDIAVTYDALRRATRLSYNSRRELIEKAYPDGAVEKFEYRNESVGDGDGVDPECCGASDESVAQEGLVSTFVDRAGATVRQEYDALGRITKIVQPDGTYIQRTYDAAGRLQTSRDENGRVTTNVYDDAGRLARVIDGTGKAQTYEYDAVGNLRFFTDALGRVTEHVYDRLNRRVETILPPADVDLNGDGVIGTGETNIVTGTQTGYDEIGRRISETDANGLTKRYIYDRLNRLVGVVDTAGQLTSFAYDELSNQVAQTDTNHRTTAYSYDSVGRRIGRRLPLGQTEILAYDAAGNLRNRTDFNGTVTTFGYDALNRLTQRTVTQAASGVLASNVSFTYTSAGQRASMVDSHGTTLYGYDNRQRLVSKASPEGTLGYSYDAVGNLLSIASSNSNGVAVAYRYDALNRLSQVVENGSETTGYGYDDVGNLTSFHTPNGVTHAYGYNALNRLTSLQVNKGASVLASYAYTQLRSGQRSSASEQFAASTANAQSVSRNVRYGYDPLYRLTGEAITANAGPTGSAGYTLDPAGNRLGRSSTIAGLSAQVFTYDANDRLTADTYDANGNTKVGRVSLNNLGAEMAPQMATDTYDSENRVSTHNGPAGPVQIVYDGDGNKVKETVNGQVFTYLIDDVNPTRHSQVVEELQNGTVIRTYTYGHDLLMQDQRSSGGAWSATWFGYDGHGSVRFLTNGTGAVTDRYDYDAFGVLLRTDGATFNRYRYGGEQFDDALGLYYLRARYLNAANGRFWTMDDFAGDQTDPASLHKYIYAHAEPVNGIDPSGHARMDELSFRNAISAMLNRTTTAAFRVTIRRVGGKMKCVVVEQIVDFAIEEGIYLFFAQTGTPYVGKSVDIPRRLREHELSKFLRNKFANLKGLFSVAPKDQKYIEQWIFDRVKDAQGRKQGEFKGSANRRNPVNKTLRALLKKLRICP